MELLIQAQFLEGVLNFQGGLQSFQPLEDFRYVIIIKSFIDRLKISITYITTATAEFIKINDMVFLTSPWGLNFIIFCVGRSIYR